MVWCKSSPQRSEAARTWRVWILEMLMLCTYVCLFTWWPSSYLSYKWKIRFYFCHWILIDFFILLLLWITNVNRPLRASKNENLVVALSWLINFRVKAGPAVLCFHLLGWDIWIKKCLFVIKNNKYLIHSYTETAAAAVSWILQTWFTDRRVTHPL